MALADDWRTLETELPERWGEAHLRLTIHDDASCERAAALLGPANPGRRGKKIDVTATRTGGGTSPYLLQRLLRRLDSERILGSLELAGAIDAPERVVRAPQSLAAAWDAELARLPDDWSDVYAEIGIASSDFLERAALLLAPLNPTRQGTTSVLRFRCARRFGYGASPEMVRRCFGRLDGEGIRGRVGVLRALSDTRPVYTQGPVWYVGGRAV